MFVGRVNTEGERETQAMENQWTLVSSHVRNAGWFCCCKGITVVLEGGAIVNQCSVFLQRLQTHASIARAGYTQEDTHTHL